MNSPTTRQKSGKSKKKQKVRILLPGGCSISEPTVHPSNWRTVSAKTDQIWYIHYRFFDAINSPKGKQRVVKGMNDFQTAAERRAVTERLLADEISLLKQGYNPITEKWTSAEQTDEIEPFTPLTQALRIAAQKAPVDDNTKPDIKWMMNYVPLAIEALEWQNMPVGDVRKKHVKRILEKCAEIKSRVDPITGKVYHVSWSDNKHNQFRTYLMIVFGEIVECDALDSNPCRELRKRKTIKKKQKTLTLKQRKSVDKHLREIDYNFWRFLHIFYHSGARETEIMKLRVKDIDLENQKFTSLVKKDRTYAEKDRTIKNIALPLWKEVLEEAKPDDFIFSYGFAPGTDHYAADNINKMWKAKVKDPLHIDVNFYCLKHLNSTQTAATHGDEAAAEQNAHKGTAMVRQIYDVERENRMHNVLKEVNNPFI